MKNNLFIVLEGVDNSGKTTVAKRLAAILPHTAYLRFPCRDTHSGKLLDSYLRAAENSALDPALQHLLFSINRYEKAEYIKKTLESGNLVCDRYWYSGAAYSAAKGLDLDWCTAIDSKLPKPDLVILLDVPVDVAAQRKGFGDEIHDEEEFLKRVQGIFLEMAKKEGFAVVNAGQPLDSVVSDVLKVVFGYKHLTEN